MACEDSDERPVHHLVLPDDDFGDFLPRARQNFLELIGDFHDGFRVQGFGFDVFSEPEPETLNSEPETLNSERSERIRLICL